MTGVASLVRTSHGRTFEAARGELLLDAALRARVVLAYSCRNGRCGTCKGKVKHGATSATQHEWGLDGAQRDEGFILTCVRSAESDLELEIDDLGDVHLSPPRTFPCRIQGLTRVAADVMQVFLRLPPTADFAFTPGQYIDVIGAGGIRRSYSIANAPRTDKQIELHIRAVPGGALSAYWFEKAKVGDLLRLRGPLGTFFLRDCEGLDVVLLATGTGIAPIKAILEDMAERSDKARSLSVIWGGRVEQDLYCSVEQESIDLAFTPVLSRADASWNGARGHVQDILIGRSPVWSRTMVYACGSETMIESARRSLADAGLPLRRFVSDAFVDSSSTP